VNAIGATDASRLAVNLLGTAADVLVRAMLRTPPADPLARRDPEAIAAFLELFGPVIDAWFAPEVSGTENAPEVPSLIVHAREDVLLRPE
jgi:hypothetical protein